MEPYGGFEVGPIRPPSECYSLLLRLTRGCSWNRCRFCGFYRGEKFGIRSPEHVKQDIDQLREWIDAFEGKSQRQPKTREEYDACSVALNWYQSGMESVFLQDGNSLVMKPEDMLDILEHLKKTFPDMGRITTYARSDAIARISDENLRRYAQLGLNRFHVGLETGNDELLTLMNKGTTKAVQIEAGQRAMAAGIEVSEFYMPALGGLEYAAQSAKDSADVINQINPDFIRIRSMALAENLEIFEDYKNGTLTRGNDVDTIKETRLFLEHLGEHLTGEVESDHILNILLELRGQMPQDKPKLLAIVDRFLELSPEEQRNFRLGRRVGLMSEMDDLKRPNMVKRVQDIMDSNGIDESNIDEVCDQLMIRAIPI